MKKLKFKIQKTIILKNYCPKKLILTIKTYRIILKMEEI